MKRQLIPMFDQLLRMISPNKKSIFLAGSEAIFDGSIQCQNFLATQGIDKKTARSVWQATELIFKDNKLVASKLYEHGDAQKRELEEGESGLPYQEVHVHPIRLFVRSETGPHQLGGQVPEGFRFPPEHNQVPFQYLGYISKEDAAFNWLPFDLPLICPIFYNIEKVFLDYSDPAAPIVIRADEYLKLTTFYEEIGPGSFVNYEPVRFDTELAYDFVEGQGHTGVPAWIQNPAIPRCPKTDRIMKFVCELGSDMGVETAETNVVPSEPFMADSFGKLNFWGDGDLYVFFEPDSKTACYIIQHT